MRIRRIFAVVACTTAVASVGAGSAFAGETTGKGKQTPIGAASEEAPHAQSICSFSGQNPERFLTGADYEPGRTQSWGQIPKAERDAYPAFFHPGESCNGHTGFFAG